MITTNNRVEHPDYYQGENGIETIEIIRHYTCDIANALKYLMRAGKKHEMGMEDAEKEIEDLKKALWYIEDYYSNFNGRGQQCICMRNAEYHTAFKEMTGHTVEDVVIGYPSPIKEAITNLLFLGLVHNGCVVVCSLFSKKTPIENIQQRITDIKNNIKN